MYIYRGDTTGERIRTALLDAVRRRVKVRILLDDFGSAELPQHFFDELIARGGHLRFFNPSRLLRVAFRDHRKLIVADEREAIVGGFNISDEYSGDGVQSGWRDLGMRISGPEVLDMEASFDRMFIASAMNRSALMLFARRKRNVARNHKAPELLTSGPRFGGASLRRWLYEDLYKGRNVDIVAAYFAPTWLLRRRLARAAKRGTVRLLLAGKSDVPILRLAGHHLYSRLLKDGAQIFEYEPQILHAKLFVIDDVLYVGSCNLDVRSLRLNFELLVRVPDERMAQQGRELIERDIALSKAVTPIGWEKETHWWQQLKRQVAYWMVTRLDPFLARRRFKSLR